MPVRAAGRALPDDAPAASARPACSARLAAPAPESGDDCEPSTDASEGRAASNPRSAETLTFSPSSERPRNEPPRVILRYLGDYEVIRRIGRGGMGEVFEAHQITLDRMVAIKMIRAGEFADDAELARFRTEAEAIAALDHPNLVEIHEVGEHEGLPYFSMKLYQGGSLEKKLDEYHADPKRTARLMIQVARAVHHAHQAAILHRDLKPANILLDDHGEPHVTDFGLAKRLDQAGELITGMVLGTPQFMCPSKPRARKTR